MIKALAYVASFTLFALSALLMLGILIEHKKAIPGVLLLMAALFLFVIVVPPCMLC